MKKTKCLIVLCMLICMLAMTACENKATGDATFSFCAAKWECQSPYYKAFKNTNCKLSSSTYCQYGCFNGQCKPQPVVEQPKPIQTTTCLEGLKCKTNNDRAYQNKDCSWGKTETCLYGCLNGICKLPQQVQTCQEGWKCINTKYKGYQASNCNWDANRQEYCAESCSDGKCVCQPKWTCQGDNAIYKSADCKVSYPVVCPFGCSDGKCTPNPKKTYLAPGEYTQITGCEPFLGDKNAPLKVLFVNWDNAPYYQEMVDDAVNNQFKTISPFKENINSIAFYSVTDLEGITCSRTDKYDKMCSDSEIYTKINEKCKINGDVHGVMTILIMETLKSGGRSIGGNPTLMFSWKNVPVEDFLKSSKNAVIHEMGHDLGLSDLYFEVLRFDAAPTGIYQPEVLKLDFNVDEPGCSKWCRSYKPVSQYTQTVSSGCLKQTKKEDCVKFGRKIDQGGKPSCEYSQKDGDSPSCCVWSDKKFKYFNTNCVPAWGSENIGIDCIGDSGCYFGAGGNYRWRPALRREESIMYNNYGSQKFDSASESQLNKVFECCLSPNANSEYCSNFRILLAEKINVYGSSWRIGSCGYKD